MGFIVSVTVQVFHNECRCNDGKTAMKAFRRLVLAKGEATAADAKQASLDTQHRLV